MTVSTVIQGIQKCQVPYHNHTTGATQPNTVPEAIHFLSLGNSKIRTEMSEVLTEVRALRDEVAALRAGR